VANKFSPVFIGGSGRSGTTVTLNLLQRHPQFHASLPREIKFLTSRHGLLDLVYTRPFSVEEDLHGYRYNVVTRALPLLGRNQMTISLAIYLIDGGAKKVKQVNLAD
jgi:hypothetical protein